MLSGGHLLLRCLEAQGVTTTFGVPGESYLDVLDALRDSPVNFVTCRQEGGAGYCAAAWGRLTGHPGIALVTRGPGATNASIGLHAAMADSSPMILFVGQASLEHLGREAFQEVDYRAFFGPLVKWATQIESADRIPEIISRAFTTAMSGRPGPVVVALPEDVLTTQTSAAPGKAVSVGEPAPSVDAIDEVVPLLNSAEKPLIIVGKELATSECSKPLAAFAEANSIPVATAFRSNDLIDNHSSSFVGTAGVGMAPHVERLITESDLVLALGVRFDEMMTKAYTLFGMPDPGLPVVHVHRSDRELGKVVQPEVSVQSSTRLFIDALGDAELTVPSARAAWCAQGRADHVSSLKAPKQAGALDMSEVMSWLQEHLPANVVMANGAGNFSAWPNKHFSLWSRRDAPWPRERVDGLRLAGSDRRQARRSTPHGRGLRGRRRLSDDDPRTGHRSTSQRTTDRARRQQRRLRDNSHASRTQLSRTGERHRHHKPGLCCYCQRLRISWRASGANRGFCRCVRTGGRVVDRRGPRSGG